MIEEALFSAEEMMEKAILVVKSELSNIRTGRANPSILNGIVIDNYGAQTPITQLASVSVPEPRMLVIKPYQNGQLGSMEKAIRNSDLGINPTNDGSLIRMVLPQLTEERRKELAKQAKAKGEEAKITVRNIRRKIMDELTKFVKNGDAPEDEVTRSEKDLDKLTQKFISTIDECVKIKENELLEV